MTMTEENEQVEGTDQVEESSADEQTEPQAEQPKVLSREDLIALLKANPDQELTVSQVSNLAGVSYQMIRNYCQMDMISSYTNEEGKRRLRAGDAVEWLEKYEANKAKREAKRQAKLEAELKGESPTD